MKNSLGSPMGSPVQDFLDEIHRTCAGDHGGQIATHIPEPAKANRDGFGLCLATASVRAKTDQLVPAADIH